jgi:hypothetical protein
MSEFYIFREIGPRRTSRPEELLKVERLSHICTVGDLMRIPAIRKPIPDTGQITREVAMCPITFLEDTRWELCFFWENDSDRSIIIFCCDSFFYDFLDD